MIQRTEMKTLLAVGALLLTAVAAQAQPSDVVQYFHTDAIGSVRVVTDNGGAVVTPRYDYTPFGVEFPTASGTNTRRFAGKEHDPETGYDYFGGRYYVPVTGRFMNVDPVLNQQAALLDPQQWNRYTYVMNRPLTVVDPDGRCPSCIGFVVGGALDVAVQMAQGRSLRDVDWTSAGISAVAGAVGGGLAVKTAQLGFLTRQAVEGGIDAAGSVAQQVHKTGTWDWTTVGIDVASGRTVGAWVGSRAEVAARGSSAYKLALAEADRMARIGARAADAGRRPSRAAARAAQAEALSDAADDLVYGRATAAAIAASQLGSEAVKRARGDRDKKDQR